MAADPVTLSAAASALSSAAPGVVAATAPTVMPAAITATELAAPAALQVAAPSAAQISGGGATLANLATPAATEAAAATAAPLTESVTMTPEAFLNGGQAPGAVGNVTMNSAPNVTTPSFAGPATGAEIPAGAVNAAGQAVAQAPTTGETLAQTMDRIGNKVAQTAGNFGNKLMDAVPAGLVAGAGTWMQQAALADADQERRAKEEQAMAELNATNAQSAQKVIDWGSQNLTPEATEARRAMAESEAYDQLLSYGDDKGMTPMIGNMSEDYLKALADRTSALASDRRQYAGLLAKTLSHAGAGSKLNTATMQLGRDLGGLGGDYASISAKANRDLGNITPSMGSMVGGQVLQGMAPSLSKL